LIVAVVAAVAALFVVFAAAPRRDMATASAPPAPLVSSAPAPRFRLQIASDIHAEFYRGGEGAADPPAAALARSDEVLLPSARHLALLGDIGLIGSRELRDFVYAAAERFDRVFLLSGNHEFYSPDGNADEGAPTFSQRRRELAELCAASPGGRVVLLDRTSLLVDGVRVLGCTLWTDVPDSAAAPLTAAMRDYHVIRPDDAPPRSAELRGFSLERARVAALLAQLRAEHARDAAWLEEELRGAAQRGEDAVVLTHHAPFLDGTSDPIFGRSPLSHGFATDMSRLFAPNTTLRAWAFGHTHYSVDFVPSGFTTRLVANQRGYRGHVSAGFRPDFVLELP